MFPLGIGFGYLRDPCQPWGCISSYGFRCFGSFLPSLAAGFHTSPSSRTESVGPVDPVGPKNVQVPGRKLKHCQVPNEGPSLCKIISEPPRRTNIKPPSTTLFEPSTTTTLQSFPQHRNKIRGAPVRNGRNCRSAPRSGRCGVPVWFFGRK